MLAWMFFTSRTREWRPGRRFGRRLARLPPPLPSPAPVYSLGTSARIERLRSFHCEKAQLWEYPPRELAATARLLAADGARHVTGQVLHVNGARTTR